MIIKVDNAGFIQLPLLVIDRCIPKLSSKLL